MNEGRNLDLMWQIVAEIVNLHKSSELSDRQNTSEIRLGNDWEQIFWSEINKIFKIRLFK